MEGGEGGREGKRGREKERGREERERGTEESERGTEKREMNREGREREVKYATGIYICKHVHLYKCTCLLEYMYTLYTTCTLYYLNT